MFKWPDTPSPRSPGHELADYAELLCWQNNVTSKRAISADIGRLDENDYAGGVPEDEQTEPAVDEAYSEIERRQASSRDGYPFVVGERGNTLHADTNFYSYRHLVYKYLLLSTRLDMARNRRHAGIDGTLLLERLAAEVVREYFGKRAESLVFGTASGHADFPAKVDDLCRKIKEGGGFFDHAANSSNVRDGKLDVVVWKHFTDGLPGKLIGFGQCKTGTNYRDQLTQLQPDAFCSKWLRSSLVLDPIRMFFVSEALSRVDWFGVSVDAGMLFDRCRIVDFCDGISAALLADITAWTEAAARSSNLPVSDLSANIMK